MNARWGWVLAAGALVGCGGVSSEVADASASSDAAIRDGSVSTDDAGDGAPSDAGGGTDDADGGCESWMQRLQAPIVPARGAADIVVYPMGGSSLTLVELTTITCTSASIMMVDDAGAGWATVGDTSSTIDVLFDGTRSVTSLELGADYRGVMIFHDATSEYAVAMASPILRDGAAIDPWTDATVADAMYRALVTTFLPTAPVDPVGTTCIASLKCVRGSFGNESYLVFRSLGLAIGTDGSGLVTKVDVSPAPP